MKDWQGSLAGLPVAPGYRSERGSSHAPSAAEGLASRPVGSGGIFLQLYSIFFLSPLPHRSFASSTSLRAPSRPPRPNSPRSLVPRPAPSGPVSGRAFGFSLPLLYLVICLGLLLACPFLPAAARAQEESTPQPPPDQQGPGGETPASRQAPEGGFLRPGPRLDAAGDRAADEPLPEIPPPDPLRRGPIRELLRYECESELARRDVILFSDGMVRVKGVALEGKDPSGNGPLETGAGRDHPGTGEATPEEGPELVLHQLTPDELEDFLARLEQDRGPEAGDLSLRAPGGDWVESCRLVLELPDQPREEHEFGPYDSLSLALSRRLKVVRDLEARAREAAQLSRLPRGYEPRPGDVLERRDGVLFEIVRDTSDRVAWELQGVEQPLIVYVPKEGLRLEFVRLVSREEP